MRVLVSFPALLFPFSPRRTMRGKVCDRRKKWTAAIMEFRATRVVLLPPPQRSLVQRQLCWMNQRERERERKRKSEKAGGRGREGAFTTSGLDFFSLLLSRCLPFLPVCRRSSPMHLQIATRCSSPLTVPVRTLLFLVICHGCKRFRNSIYESQGRWSVCYDS